MLFIVLTLVYPSRVCVYTAGSPINNRALFPCQEPPVAMSTWQATIRAPSECVVLVSGENQAAPTLDEDTGDDTSSHHHAYYSRTISISLIYFSLLKYFVFVFLCLVLVFYFDSFSYY